MSILEKDIENKFVDDVAKLGCLAPKLEVEGDKGWPDRLIVMPNGKVAYIEFKRPGGTTSEHQKDKIAKLMRLGHNVIVTNSTKTALTFIRCVLDDTNKCTPE